MPRTRELPPVPERPVFSPPANIAGESEYVVDPGDGDGPNLQARLRVTPNAARAVLFCHPHPLYGGSMHSAVVVAIAKIVAEQAGPLTTTLRFNYRGVGTSEGTYDAGRGEVDDARAALRALKSHAPGAKITLCGYSFGTFVGLRAAAIEGGVERVVLVAPAVRIFSFIEEDGRAFQGRISVFVGDNDEFCDVEEAEALAGSLGASLRVFPGADHYFMRSRRKLGETVLPLVVPEAPALPES